MLVHQILDSYYFYWYENDSFDWSFEFFHKCWQQEAYFFTIMITAFSRAEQIEERYRNRLGAVSQKTMPYFPSSEMKQQTDWNRSVLSLRCRLSLKMRTWFPERLLFSCNHIRKKFERRERALAIRYGNKAVEHNQWKVLWGACVESFVFPT